MGVPKWLFPKIGDPNIVPKIVGSGSYFKDPKIRYPLFSETPKWVGSGLWG